MPLQADIIPQIRRMLITGGPEILRLTSDYKTWTHYKMQ